MAKAFLKQIFLELGVHYAILKRGRSLTMP